MLISSSNPKTLSPIHFGPPFLLYRSLLRGENSKELENYFEEERRIRIMGGTRRRGRGGKRKREKQDEEQRDVFLILSFQDLSSLFPTSSLLIPNPSY